MSTAAVQSARTQIRILRRDDFMDLSLRNTGGSVHVTYPRGGRLFGSMHVHCPLAGREYQFLTASLDEHQSQRQLQAILGPLDFSSRAPAAERAA